ncbi:MAG: hypothetical protein ACI8RA_001846, partial [Chlamydiales bacterium]
REMKFSMRKDSRKYYVKNPQKNFKIHTKTKIRVAILKN